MDEPAILSFYEHEHPPSVFVMFTKTYGVVWCYSGNELRRAYLERPDEFLSGPIELPIPEYLDELLTDYYENF